MGALSMDFPETPFWNFSLRVYGTDKIPAACLRLQDRHGIDVNLLLFALWLARSDAADTASALDAAIDASAVWHCEVVRPLRAVRQRMKDGVPPVDNVLAQSLRARLQKLEIDTEHAEQVTLWQAAGSPSEIEADPASPRQAARLLGRYFSAAGWTVQIEDAEDVKKILSATFPNSAVPEPGAILEILLDG
jgi:uncharacterized protein (TIGR02444 family)